MLQHEGPPTCTDLVTVLTVIRLLPRPDTESPTERTYFGKWPFALWISVVQRQFSRAGWVSIEDAQIRRALICKTLPSQFDGFTRLHLNDLHVDMNEGAIYGVLGNHDTNRMAPALEEMGIRMLLNDARRFARWPKYPSGWH